MTAYVLAGYIATFGALVLYGVRLLLRRRVLERRFADPYDRNLPNGRA